MKINAYSGQYGVSNYLVHLGVREKKLPEKNACRKYDYIRRLFKKKRNPQKKSLNAMKMSKEIRNKLYLSGNE